MTGKYYNQILIDELLDKIDELLYQEQPKPSNELTTQKLEKFRKFFDENFLAFDKEEDLFWDRTTCALYTKSSLMKESDKDKDENN